MSTKLKNILSEIKWEGKDINLGQVYTAKDIPPFKTPTQLKEEEIKEDDLSVKKTIDRRGLWNIYTPQVFKRKILETAFEEIEKGKEFTDESGMLEEFSGQIQVYIGATDNIKITNPEDINLVKSILTAQGRIVK